MFEAFSTWACAFIGLVIAVLTLHLLGFFDVASEAFVNPQSISRQQQLEDLCVSGNANACKVYEIGYKRRCIL